MRHFNRWLAGAIVLIVAADWATKLWIVNRVAFGQTVAVVEGWFYLAHRRNTGVAFSMFADLPERWGAPVLVAVTIVSLGLFVWMLRTTYDVWSRVAIGLVIAGAVGNLGDRIVNGAVTDFLLFSFFPFVFNVADAAITVGGVLLALRLLQGAEPQHPPAASASS